MPDATAPPLAPEANVELHDASGRIARWFCTPEFLDQLAAGWLLGEGRLGSARDIGPMEIDQDGGIVRLAGPHGDPRTTVDPTVRPRAGNVDPVPTADELRGWFETMFDRGVLRDRTGGVHTGALVLAGSVAVVREDVSRHCVVDKLIGWAALEERSIEAGTLLLSGRISAAIAAKGARTGIRVMATMSIPTTLAADIAAEAGITLVGRARAASPHVYSPGT